MNVMDKKTERARDRHIAIKTSEMFLGVALLTYDDLEGVNDEKTRLFVHGFAENVNGYAECGGYEAIKAELADRGIEICLDGRKTIGTKPNQHQRGRGEWITVETEDGKKKTACSHCGKGDAVQKPYCGWCGADMRKRNNTE